MYLNLRKLEIYTIGLHDEQIHSAIRKQQCQMICINDTADVGDFEKQKKRIIQSFENILPKNHLLNYNNAKIVGFCVTGHGVKSNDFVPDIS